MYICEDVDKLEDIRNKINNENDYPKEDELPLIYVNCLSVKEIDLNAYYSAPYYDEINIELINATNTSCARRKIYSNYERVLGSIYYIQKNECRPISILKDGETYFIENGKHRYLAHIILGKNKMPVSIRECVRANEDSDFIQYKRNLFSDDGQNISYPEKVIEFYEENKQIFRDITKIEMQFIEEKRFKLIITKRNQDVIEISNGISAGNNLRSSLVAMRLIKECGYDIDETYIKTHQEFVLEDKYDANNIEFNDLIISDSIIQQLKCNIKKIEKPMGQSEKINKLHTFLCNYKSFNTCGTHMNIFYTGEIEIDESIYYIISSEDKDCSYKIFSYIFSEKNKAQSNLGTKYIGKIESRKIFFL